VRALVVSEEVAPLEARLRVRIRVRDRVRVRVRVEVAPLEARLAGVSGELE